MLCGLNLFNMLNLKTMKALVGVSLVAATLVGSVASAAITSTLKLGPRGAQVKELQQFLNGCSADTMVAASGVGSAGNESTYFGPATKKAVMAFQKKMGIAQVGQTGPATRAAIAAGCGSNNNNNNNDNNQTGPVKVSLSSDTPASGSYISTASGIVFAKFAFTGNGSVTSVKLMRTGVSSSSTVSNVYLYDGNTRLTDGASISSDNTITFNSINGIFNVNGTKTISVVADAAAADYSIGFTLTSFTSGGVATSVSVAGNQMYGATATLAAAAMTSATGSGNTDAGNDIVVWQGTATISTRDAIFKSLALRQIGSISSGDIRNFKLYVDGVMAGSAVASLDSNGYVTFTPSVVLKTGARTLKVTADVIGGASRTVQMSLRGAYDLKTTDTQYNANGATTGTFPFGPAAFTVNSGTMTVVRANDSASTNLVVGATDQSLAKYTFTAYGEAVKVETLGVGMITNGTPGNVTIRNVRVMVNGSQVGSTTNVAAAASYAADAGTSFTTNFVVYPGTPAVVEIRGDMIDSNTTSGDDISDGTVTTLQALLVKVTNNAVPQTSLGTVSAPSATNTLGNNLTITSGSISIAKTSSYANRNVAVPTSAYKIGSYQLSGNSAEAVNLNTIYVGFTAGSTVTEATDLTDLYVVYGGVQSPIKGTVSSTILNGNSWSINKTLGVNETMQIDVYATLASTVSTNAIITTLAVAGTTANSGITVYADSVADTVLDAGFTGQTITGATGSVTMSLDASTASSAIIPANTGSVKTLTAKIAAVTDSYTVTDMVVTVSNASAVNTVTLKDHDTGAIVGTSKPGATSITWSGLSYPVTAGTSKYLDVELALSSVGVGAGTSGSAITTAITGFTARNAAGTSAAGTGSASGNAIYVYAATPTITNVSLPSSYLNTGTQTVSKFTVSSNGGTIGWKKMIFTVTRSISGTDTLATPTLWDATTNTQIAGAATFTGSVEADNGTSGTIEFVATNEQQISGSKTYVLKVVVAGSPATGDNLNVSIAQPSSYVAPAAYATVAATTSSFTWTDVSASSHDTTTLDWSNGFLVKTLPTDSQTLSR